MATTDDFSTAEWKAISDGPVYAGYMVITASRGGTIRETFSMSKAWVEARQRHGESEFSVRGLTNGDPRVECPLTEAGREQAT